MYLIFDTETTGFYNPKLSATSPGQARIAQLAAIKLDKDFNEVGRLNTLIKPSGHWKMSEGAESVHGISEEDCRLKGRELEDVMSEFCSHLASCDYLICHNQAFDGNIIKVEKDNCKTIFAAEDIFNVIPICTMELMTDVCKLPFTNHKPKYGQKYKWPKLEEAMAHIKSNIGVEGTWHDAMFDVLACAEVFKWLVKNNHIKGIKNGTPSLELC